MDRKAELKDLVTRFDNNIAAYKDADVVVFASPVYYFSMTAQIEAAIQRVYCIGMPPKSGGIPVHDGARCQEKGCSTSRRQTCEKVVSPNAP